MPSLTTVDGLTLEYHEWGTERRGERPPVVLQHGFIAGTHWNWVVTGVVDALVAAERHVVALDARGHGGSAAPHEPAYYGEAKMAADLSTLYDLLDAPLVHQVGYSMGAIISLIAAIRDRRIGRLVVGGVGAGVVELGGVDTRMLPNEMLREALTTHNPSTITHEGAAGFRAFADMVGADRTALAAQAQVVHAEPIPLADITAPTLLIAGTEDPLAGRPHILTEAIAGAHLLTLPGDHLQVPGDPCFVAEIIGFLDA